MTAHELARELLKLDDNPVLICVCNNDEQPLCSYKMKEIKTAINTNYNKDIDGNNIGFSEMPQNYNGFISLGCYE
jgi:hypothetical protein